MKPEALQQLICELVKREYNIEVTPVVTSADAEFGDCSCNVAMQLAGRLNQPAIQIAENLAAKLSSPDIAAAGAAGAGFINVSFHSKYWLEQLKDVNRQYGRSQTGKWMKVQVEFISANPTGPLTLGNGRGGFWGDVLANVLDWVGYTVSREYYINDAGNQVQKLRDSVWVKIAEKLGLPDSGIEPGYLGPYIEDLADQVIAVIKRSVPIAETKKLSYEEVGKYIEKFNLLAHIIEWIKASVKRMEIDFDVWYSEAGLHHSGAVDAVMKKLKLAGATAEHDGAVWLKHADKDKERVLVKADGSYTYLTPDLAYHYDKFVKRGFDKVINLWGADHAAQVGSLVYGVEKLGIEGELDIILFQLARLIRDGKEVKVSKRAGTYVTMDELLEEVDPAVVRFFFLMRGCDTQMDFDLDLAKEESQKNPYHYVMYAYVRAKAIMAKAKDKGLKPAPIKDLVGVERKLVRQIVAFPALLEQIATDYGVQRLAFYGMDLAKLFHEYYEAVPILSSEKADAEQRLRMIKHFTDLMEAYFQVLGITPVTKM